MFDKVQTDRTGKTFHLIDNNRVNVTSLCGIELWRRSNWSRYGEPEPALGERVCARCKAARR